MMRYVDYGAGGGPEVLQVRRTRTPSPQPGEVLIEVVYAGVNRPDVAQRIGRYPPPPGASPIIGLEVSGTVAAVGAGVTLWRTGDRVCALVPGGGYAEYCCAPAEHCLPIPDGLGLEKAAALPETAFTVWDNVFLRCDLKAGETFLVHGGSGGIGTMAIQMAKAMGARVMTTVGSQEKRAYCERAGADLVVNYKCEDFVAAARNFTAGEGLNVVLDMVGGAYLDRNLEALAMDGRIAVIAFMGGMQSTIDVTRIFRKRATINGSTLRPRSLEYKAMLAAQLKERWWPRLTDPSLQPIIHQVFPLEEARKAHELMESGVHAGKIVLALGSP